MPEQNPCIADLNLGEQEGQPQWYIHIKYQEGGSSQLFDEDS
jgi:hypothetical protein